MAWTLFWDMHSGGDQKLDWAKIYIEANEDQAIRIFKQKFGRDPNHITCNCCGEDYSISESETLELASGYHRGLDCYYNKETRESRYLEPNENPPEGSSWECHKGYGEKILLEDYIKQNHVCVIYASDPIFSEKFDFLDDSDYDDYDE